MNPFLDSASSETGAAITGIERISLCHRCENSFNAEADDASEDLVDILRAGVLPTPVDAACSDDIIKSAERQLLTAEHELRFLRRAVIQLEKQKCILTHRVGIRRAHIAPVRRLPQEILSEIFYHCCQNFCGINEEHYCMPLVLGAVCKRWRDVAHHDSPRIWTDVGIRDRPDGSVMPAQTLLRRLELYFRNSRGLGLWRRVRYGGREGKHTIPGVAWPLFVKNADRWLNLYIGAPDFFATTGDIALPRLRWLSLDLEEIPLEGDVYKLFERAPALRFVEIDYLDLPLKAVLPLCTRLATWDHTPAVLAADDWNVVGDARAHRHVLPHLRTLIIDFSVGLDDWSGVLEWFSTPNVEFVSFKWTNPSDSDEEAAEAAELPEDGERLSAFYYASSCCLYLRTVVLEYPNLQARNWVFSMQELRILSLHSDPTLPLDNDCIRQLAIHDAGTPRYLPRLQEVHLRGTMKIRGNTLLKAIKARKTMGRGLTGLFVDISLADMDELGEPVTWARIERNVPGAFIAGLDLLLAHVMKKERRKRTFGIIRHPRPEEDDASQS